MTRLDDLLGRHVSLAALALLRIPVGVLVVVHLWPFLTDLAAGQIYQDVFHDPYAGWYPDLPRPLYGAVLVSTAVAGLTLAVGLFSRLSAGLVLAGVTYNLFLSATHVHNNRAYLVIVLATLAVTPCGAVLSLDALRRRRGLVPPDHGSAADGPAWPLWLVRFEASTIYLASGISKAVDPDWIGGEVTWLRVVNGRAQLEASTLPATLQQLFLDRSFHSWVAPVIVTTEVFIGAGLWWRRTRNAALLTALAFHVAIGLSAAVQIFSLLAIAALCIWAVPSTGDRTLTVDVRVPRQRRLAALTRRLDWLARFRIEEGEALSVTEPDGRVEGGRLAVLAVASRLPLTAPVALPLLALAGLARRRRTAAGPRRVVAG
jgi:uncharacterized membrane protein YphA (DoxX/SURF4 family)